MGVINELNVSIQWFFGMVPKTEAFIFIINSNLCNKNIVSIKVLVWSFTTLQAVCTHERVTRALLLEKSLEVL